MAFSKRKAVLVVSLLGMFLQSLSLHAWGFSGLNSWSMPNTRTLLSTASGGLALGLSAITLVNLEPILYAPSWIYDNQAKIVAGAIVCGGLIGWGLHKVLTRKTASKQTEPNKNPIPDTAPKQEKSDNHEEWILTDDEDPERKIYISTEDRNIFTYTVYSRDPQSGEKYSCRSTAYSLLEVTEDARKYYDFSDKTTRTKINVDATLKPV